MYIRDVREWLFTFAFPPIPMDLFPFPCNGPKYHELKAIYVRKTKSTEKRNTSKCTENMVCI